jgi:hypothetical protein
VSSQPPHVYEECDATTTLTRGAGMKCYPSVGKHIVGIQILRFAEFAPGFVWRTADKRSIASCP